MSRSFTLVGLVLAHRPHLALLQRPQQRPLCLQVELTHLVEEQGAAVSLAKEPITLANLRKGKYRPCSRNPVLAQCLSYFHRIEERGSGFRRMTDQMLDHGLDRPLLGTDTGYFQVTFLAPGEDIERLRVPESRLVVTPAVEAQLNERQRRILAHALESGSVTRRWCVAEFEVANDTAGRALKSLMDLGLLVVEGKGRAVRYVPQVLDSTGKRPIS